MADQPHLALRPRPYGEDKGLRAEEGGVRIFIPGLKQEDLEIHDR